jgi:hypothetical protein
MGSRLHRCGPLTQEPLARAVVQARRDDHDIEARIHYEVCHGMLRLRQVQKLELAYKRKSG